MGAQQKLSSWLSAFIFAQAHPAVEVGCHLNHSKTPQLTSEEVKPQGRVVQARFGSNWVALPPLASFWHSYVLCWSACFEPAQF